MTVLVALERARLDDVVTVTPAAAGVGESTRGSACRRAAHRRATSRSRDARPERERRRRRRSRCTSAAARCRRFVALMNAKARVARSHVDTHFENPHGLDAARPRLERARRDDAALGGAPQPVHPRRGRRGRRRRIAGGRTLTSTDDLIGKLPLVGAKTGHTQRRRLVAGRGGRARRRADHGIGARHRRREAQRNADLAALLDAGASRSTTPSRRSTTPRLRARRDGLRQAAGRARGAARRSFATCGWTGRSSSASSSARPLALPVTRGQRVGEVQGVRGRSADRARTARRRRVGPGRRRSGEGRVVRAPHGPPSRRARLIASPTARRGSHVIVTVTLNAALDRSLTVPIFQLGHRHRASERARARRRQGDQRRARAEAARRAGRRDRPRRRPHGHADRRGADRGGDPQRLRPDPATSRGRRRPSSIRPRAPTRRSTSGARRSPRTSSRSCSRSSATSRAGRRLRGLRRLAAARRRRGLLRRRRARADAGSATRVVLDAEGEPLRNGDRGRAVARLAEPARGRAARRARSSRTTTTS